MDKIVAAYEKDVAFFTVYIREAHPTDGWRMSWNDEYGIQAKQPTTFDERTKIADQCNSSLQFLCPMLVDSIDDKVSKAYAAFPDRLYLIDREGRIAYKGGRGPFGYKPRELERSLVMLLMDQAIKDKDKKAKAEKAKAAKAKADKDKDKAGKDKADKDKADKDKAGQDKDKADKDKASKDKDKADKDKADKDKADKDKADKDKAGKDKEKADKAKGSKENARAADSKRKDGKKPAAEKGPEKKARVAR